MPGVRRAEKVMRGVDTEGEGYMFASNRSQKWKFHFNVRNNVFLRLGVGFSHEGFRVWVKFWNPF